MTRILVTGAGGPAAVCVLDDLAESGNRLHAVDIDRCAAGLYLVPAHRRALVPRGDDPRFVSALLALCERWSIDVLVPTVDCELPVVAEHRSAFEQRGTRVLVAELASLRVCLDKALLPLALDGRVPLPRTEVLDARTRLGDWEFPVIVKPRSGSGGRGVVCVRGPDDLRGLPRDGSSIIQALLPGQEYSVDVLADAHGRPLMAVPRERLKVDSGIAVAARTVRDPELEETACRVVDLLGLAHVSNVQFKRDARGRPRLLEVNPRFPGTMALTIAAGVPMPRLAIDQLVGQRAPRLPLPSFREVAIVRTWQNHVVDAACLVDSRPLQLAQ